LAIVSFVVFITNGYYGKKAKKWLVKTLFFDGLFALYLEGYFEFLISSLMTFEAKSTDTAGEQFSYIIATFSFFVTTMLLPLSILIVIVAKLNVLKSRKFKKVLGVLYSQFHYDRRGSRSFYFSFIIRRLFFVLIVFKIKMPVIT